MVVKRQIVLDTETTGLEPAAGHRVIEIGAVELIDRHFTGNNFHKYLNPGDFKIDPDAVQVHGITQEFLKDQPVFADIVTEFLAYINGAELIIHNAPFDVGFLNNEIKLLGGNIKDIHEYSSVVDTLLLARKKHPGKPNNLDALCKRYKVDLTERNLHGGLLDARLLAEVYLRMTQGQKRLFNEDAMTIGQAKKRRTILQRDTVQNLPVIFANDEEKLAHRAFLRKMHKGEVNSLWETEEELSQCEIV